MSTPSRPSHETAHETTSGEEEIAIFFSILTQKAEDEELLFVQVKQLQQTLSDEISSMVSALLGPLFRLQKIEIRRGSVEFWVYVAGGFTLISHYVHFVHSLELLAKQIQELLSSILSMFLGVRITGGWWTPVRPKPRRFAPFHQILQNPNLIILLMASYLILSHAFMLAVLVRILLKGFLATK